MSLRNQLELKLPSNNVYYMNIATNHFLQPIYIITFQAYYKKLEEIRVNYEITF